MSTLPQYSKQFNLFKCFHAVLCYGYLFRITKSNWQQTAVKKVGKERIFVSVHATVTLNEICNLTKIERGLPWLIKIFPMVLLFKSRQFIFWFI